MEITTIYFDADKNAPKYSKLYTHAIVELKNGYIVTTYYSRWNSDYDTVTREKL